MNFQEQKLAQSDTELAAALLRFKSEQSIFARPQQPALPDRNVATTKQECQSAISSREKKTETSSGCAVSGIRDTYNNPAALEVTGGPCSAKLKTKKDIRDIKPPLTVVNNSNEKVYSTLNSTKFPLEPIRKHNFVAFHSYHENSPANVSSNESSTDENDSIRRDKIEAALQSLPQRGRKRDNLSENERLELTRTRNREHAKSTRIRKKARYQELLEKEQTLEKHEAATLLDEKRRKIAFEFAQARLNTLQNFLDQSGRLVDAGCIVPLVYVELDDFSFYSNIVKATNNFNGLSGREALRKFDELLADRILACSGTRESCKLLNRVMSTKSVALNEQGTALLQTELTVSSNSATSTSLATMWFRIDFAANSEKFQRVEISLADSSFEKSDTDCLVSQRSHPSMVSLDPLQQNFLKMASEPETDHGKTKDRREEERSGDFGVSF